MGYVDMDRKNAKILVVDDSPVMTSFMHEILIEEGYPRVVEVNDPRDALELYRRERFDMAFLDVQMPELDGIELMKLLHAEARILGEYLPILIMTTLTDRDTCYRALQAGAYDFVLKPISVPEVMYRLRNVLEVRRLYMHEHDEKNRLDYLVRLRTKELADTQLDVIRRLSHMGEYRDQETGEHIIRMSKSCYILASALEMKQAEMLLQASPMHDVGKVGIPDNILLKPGPLTDEEWVTMRKHTVIGASILSDGDSDLMRMAHDVALNHHEKWDGTGYPNKLSGTDIPIEARIVSLCDVFDALVSPRPYKKAWAVRDAVDYIESKSGVQFDPDLIEPFKNVLSKILDVHAHFKDKDPS